MAQFRKRGASFSTSQPCRAACIHGIWKILFSWKYAWYRTSRHMQVIILIRLFLPGEYCTFTVQNVIWLNMSLKVRIFLIWDKQQCTYPVDPLKAWYFTWVYLFLQPWAHTHSLHGHSGLWMEKRRESECERESGRVIWTVSSSDSYSSPVASVASCCSSSTIAL